MGRRAVGQLELDLWGLSPAAAEQEIAASQQTGLSAERAGGEQRETREEGDGEPLRGDRTAPLGEVRAEPGGGAAGPDRVLQRAGLRGADAGRRADGVPGRGRLFGGDLFGEGRPAPEREENSGGD